MGDNEVGDAVAVDGKASGAEVEDGEGNGAVVGDDGSSAVLGIGGISRRGHRRRFTTSAPTATASSYLCYIYN